MSIFVSELFTRTLVQWLQKGKNGTKKNNKKSSYIFLRHEQNVFQNTGVRTKIYGVNTRKATVWNIQNG